MTKKFDAVIVLKQLKEIGDSIKILLVENDPIIREQRYHILSRFCKDIDVAETGTQALVLCQEKKYDLIITDLIMPDISGIEMIRSFRHLDSHIKIIVISEHTDANTSIELLKIGIDGFIQKPFNFHEAMNVFYTICNKIYERHLSLYLKTALESLNQELLQDTHWLKKEIEQLQKQIVSNRTSHTQKMPMDEKEHQMIEIIHQHIEKISAKDFFETYPLELDKTNEDLEELENRFNYIILNSKRQVPEKIMDELIGIIRSYAKTIETIPQFGSLAFAIRELAYTFESVNEKAQISTILPMLSALINNLEQWRLQIFFYRSVEDIHYMDNSILSDTMSLKAMIDTSSQSHSSEDEFEFF